MNYSKVNRRTENDRRRRQIMLGYRDRPTEEYERAIQHARNVRKQQRAKLAKVPKAPSGPYRIDRRARKAARRLQKYGVNISL